MDLSLKKKTVKNEILTCGGAEFAVTNILKRHRFYETAHSCYHMQVLIKKKRVTKRTIWLNVGFFRVIMCKI